MSSMVSPPPSSSIALGNMSPNPPPTLEEDLSHAHLWSQDNDQRDSQDMSPPRSSTSTEKGKERQLDEDIDIDIIENPSSESYPPTNDDAAETRRVEEVRYFRFRSRSITITSSAHLKIPVCRTYVDGSWLNANDGELHENQRMVIEAQVVHLYSDK
jgi:hypothetical protein